MVELHRLEVLPSVMRWRIEALRDIAGQQPHPRLLAANRIYFREHIPDGTYAAFMATEDGEECGCGGIRFFDAPPSTDNPAGRCACITDIYVREAFRKGDIAARIVHLLTEEASKLGCGKIYIDELT